MKATAQARLDLLALEGGVARFGTTKNGHAISVLDLVGSEASMSIADDATQEELLAGRAQFLNAQTAPFQGVSYPPNTFSQVSLQQFLASFGQVATPAGSVQFQVASGSVILYTSTTDNRTNDSALFIVKSAD